MGAKIRVRTSAAWQTRVVGAASACLSGQSPVQHFGLGEDDRVRELSIRRPSTTEIADLDGGRRFAIAEDSPSPICCADPACPH